MYSQNPNPKLNSSVQQAPSRVSRRASPSADAGIEERQEQIVSDPSSSHADTSVEKVGDVYQEPPPFGSRYVSHWL
jgi:hypothetical protein